MQINPQHADYVKIRHAGHALEEAGADIVFNWDHFWPLSGLGSAANRVFWGTADANPQARGLRLARKHKTP